MDMRERIHTGKLFLDNCQGLDSQRILAKKRMKQFNLLDPDEPIKKKELINQIFQYETDCYIEMPFHFTYGCNIKCGKHCYINYNCNFIDDGYIQIGNGVLFGPNLTIATVSHPIHPEYRKFMYADEVNIGDHCWIGAGVVINPGVTIGKNSVIGSGSVVVKDIPENSVAVGNPCQVIRTISETDLDCYRKGKYFDENELKELEEENQK